MERELGQSRKEGVSGKTRKNRNWKRENSRAMGGVEGKVERGDERNRGGKRWRGKGEKERRLVGQGV